jgi:hypothetical protein
VEKSGRAWLKSKGEASAAMKLIPPKKIYLPAISILAVVMVLMVIIGISTFQNLDREKQTMRTFLHSQGDMALEIIGARIRA